MQNKLGFSPIVGEAIHSVTFSLLLAIPEIQNNKLNSEHRLISLRLTGLI
jgi:hypothetical protein